MKNNKLKIAGGLLLLFIILIFSLNVALDGFIKTSVEQNTSELMQTEVDIQNVDLSLFNGTGVVHSFTIANPDRFSEASAVQIDKIKIKIDLSTLLSDTIVVETITLLEPVLNFEQKGLGINLRTLNQNMGLAADDEGPLLVIEKLTVENGIVRVSSSLESERKAEARIDRFELNDIGQAGNNTIKQGIREILDPLLERAIREAISEGLLEQLQNKLQDLLGSDEEGD